jgi:hypothetical protein
MTMSLLFFERGPTSVIFFLVGAQQTLLWFLRNTETYILQEYYCHQWVVSEDPGQGELRPLHLGTDCKAVAKLY